MLGKVSCDARYKYHIELKENFDTYFPFNNVTIDNTKLDTVMGFFFRRTLNKYIKNLPVDIYYLISRFEKLNPKLNIEYVLKIDFLFPGYPELSQIEKIDSTISGATKEFEEFVTLQIYQFIFNNCFQINNNNQLKVE